MEAKCAIVLLMKLRQEHADFQVEELTDVTPAAEGPFSFYRLEKDGWTTPDALAAIRRRWKLEARRVSYGGLKDRHAQTVQYITILHGPRRNLTLVLKRFILTRPSRGSFSVWPRGSWPS